MEHLDLLGGIYLKNMITQCWRNRDATNSVDGEMPFVISDEDKSLIRNHIIEAIIHSPELIRYLYFRQMVIYRVYQKTCKHYNLHNSAAY
jgi:hypothetical protein